MNILACIKQVPDTETQIKVKADGAGIDATGIKYIMCPYDEFGVEQAIKTKEALTGEVTVLSLGPDRVVETLRTALAMGADKAVHVKDASWEKADSLGTAQALADAIKAIPFDVVFCGKKAIDGDNMQVGVMLAELLNIPHVAAINKLEIKDGKLTATRPIEGGAEILEVALPAVITCEKGLNEPRYASLPGIMKAKKKPLQVKDVDTGTPKVQVVKYQMPPERPAGKKIEGELPDTAKTLVKLLREEAKVI